MSHAPSPADETARQPTEPEPRRGLLAEALDARSGSRVGPNDILRFVLEVFAMFSLGFWGAVAWPFPWNIVVAVLTPLIAIALWALFRSPAAVFRIDALGRALVETVIMLAAALAWWILGQPVIAGVFTVVFVVSGIINGWKEFR